jgi:CheY-like chemotaxis protein
MSALLLVEDDPNDVLFLQKGLEKAGGVETLRVVRDGLEALDYLNGSGAFSDRERHPRPSLMVLDLKLPRLSGLELLRRMRETPDLKAPQVAILTSSREASDIERAYALGAAAYLVKPVGFEQFRGIAAAILRAWRALTSGAPCEWPEAQPRP